MMADENTEVQGTEVQAGAPAAEAAAPDQQPQQRRGRGGRGGGDNRGRGIIADLVEPTVCEHRH